MVPEPRMPSDLNRLRKVALMVFAVAGVAVGIGAALDLDQFLRSYLLAFLFWVALPLGSLALLMLHRLTSGSWGFVIRRVLEAATRTLPLMALLFVPLALSVHRLYEWSHPEVVAADPVLQHKQAWLNVPGFRLRAIAYFALWIALAWILNRLSARLDRASEPRTQRRLRALAGPGIGLYVISMTLASVDWAMSLEPHWFSTMYGLTFVVGQGLSTFSFAIVVSAWLAAREPFARWLGPDQFHDLGKLLFAFVLLWAYLAYSQYLIVWSGNISEETPWYLHRSSHGWQAVALALIGLHFFLPFGMLLTRKVKRTPALLAKVAAGLLIMRLVDLAWLIVPAFHPGGIALSWMDLAVPVAMGGLWLALFLGGLASRPLASLQDAGFTQHLEGGAQAHA